MIGSRHLNHTLYLRFVCVCLHGHTCAQRKSSPCPAVYLSYNNLHANWTHRPCRLKRTSVADCFSPVLHKLKYENQEGKRQMILPRAESSISLPAPPPPNVFGRTYCSFWEMSLDLRYPSGFTPKYQVLNCCNFQDVFLFLVQFWQRRHSHD